MSAHRPADAADVLTVLSYNIRNAYPDPGHEWRDRAPLLVAAMRRLAPDIAGLQEALPDQLAHLRAALPEYGVAGSPRDAAGLDEACPVLWRRDRFTLVDDGQFWLSDTPDAAGSNGWGSLCPRCVTWVRLRDAGDGLVLAVNTHLDHEQSAHGDWVRASSARLIADRITGGPAPIVLTGDMNAPTGSAVHRALAASGLVDAATGRDRSGTFHDYGREPAPLPIDAVFHTDALQTLGVAAVVDEGTRRASDHYPLVARLTKAAR